MKPHARTYAHTHGQIQMDQLWYEINVPFFLQEKAGTFLFKMSILRIHLQYLNGQKVGKPYIL